MCKQHVGNVEHIITQCKITQAERDKTKKKHRRHSLNYYKSEAKYQHHMGPCSPRQHIRKPPNDNRSTGHNLLPNATTSKETHKLEWEEINIITQRIQIRTRQSNRQNMDHIPDNGWQNE